MANTLFLKLDGITGDAVEKGHEGEIEVLTLGWEVTNKATVASEADGGAGKAVFQDIRITKKTDSASAQLFRHCCTSQHISKGTITAAQSTEENTFLTIDLTELTVTLYELGLSANAPAETITLAYRSIEIDYKKQDAKGALQNAGTSGWDIGKNAAI